MLKWKFILYLVLGFAAFLWLVKAPLLSHYISKKLDLPILMEWVSIWPTESNIRGLKIRNPKGFDLPYALMAEEVRIEYQLTRLFAENTIIDQIVCNDLTLYADHNHWDALLQKREEIGKFTIQKCVLNHVTIRSYDGEGNVVERHVNHMELRDIHSDHGFPLEEIVHKILER